MTHVGGHSDRQKREVKGRSEGGRMTTDRPVGRLTPAGVDSIQIGTRKGSSSERRFQIESVELLLPGRAVSKAVSKAGSKLPPPEKRCPKYVRPYWIVAECRTFGGAPLTRRRQFHTLLALTTAPPPEEEAARDLRIVGVVQPSAR